MFSMFWILSENTLPHKLYNLYPLWFYPSLKKFVLTSSTFKTLFSITEFHNGQLWYLKFTIYQQNMNYLAWIYCNRNRVVWNIMQYATSFMKKPKESLELMVERCSVCVWLSDMIILRNYVYRLSLLESVSRVENKLCEEENKLLGFIMEIPYEAVKEMSSSRGAQVH